MDNSSCNLAGGRLPRSRCRICRPGRGSLPPPKRQQSRDQSARRGEKLFNNPFLFNQVTIPGFLIAGSGIGYAQRLAMATTRREPGTGLASM